MRHIENFKNLIRLIVSIFASREFAFVYCIIGTLSQTAHTYYLIESISSLTGWSKFLQAAGLSIFISSSLLFFTAIADNDEDSPDYRRIHLGVNLFMVIEIIINCYYYASHLLIKTSEPNWVDFVFAILVSCLIPVTIKLYAGIIKAKEWLEILTNKEEQNQKEQAETTVEAEKIQEPITAEPITEPTVEPEPEYEDEPLYEQMEEFLKVEPLRKPVTKKLNIPTISVSSNNN
jgi:hypothetical protein|nr:MAG TPA: hypothetical protein [Caudoviricetes sp.]